MSVKVCAGPGCSRPPRTLGLCPGHREQLRKGKSLTPLLPRRTFGSCMVRDPEGRKQCRDCQEWLPESDFNRRKSRPDGLQDYCRECVAKRRDSSQNRDWWLRHKYGISLEQYEQILVQQDGRCGACGTDDSKPRKSFAVDHDHSCCPGKRACGNCVRGLLCSTCNSGLGFFNDDPARLQSAIDYLQRTQLMATTNEVRAV